MKFSILHHEDFRKGGDIGYGFGMDGEPGSEQRKDSQRLYVLLNLGSDDYDLAGVVDAADAEDAFRVTQNGMPFTASGWASRSTSVGDLIYAGDGEPRLFLVASVGMVEIEVPSNLMWLLDRASAVVAEQG